MSDLSEDKENRGIKVKSKGYSYRFSRGLLAHGLEHRGLSLEKAYKVARKVHNLLMSEGITTIKEDDLRKYIRDEAIKIAGEEVATHYNLIEKWRNSRIPLILLISGAKGTGTSTIGKILSEKLAFPQLVSTSVVTQVLRRMISQDLAPELHTTSYLAHQKLRPVYSVLYDKVVIGFEEHARFPAEAVEALVRRAINEGLTMLIRGEHLVPRFLSYELIEHPNVIYITLEVKDEEIHKKRLLYYSNPKTKQEKVDNFEAIRKIHDYLVEEAKNRKHKVIKGESVSNAVNEIFSIVLDRLNEMFSEQGASIKYKPFDRSIIHS